MATTTTHDELALPPGEGHFADGVRRRSPGWRAVRKLSILGLVLCIVLIGAAVGISKLTGLLSGKADQNLLTHRVKRGDLQITVTEDGNVESARNVDVKCEVAGGSTILWIIKDGTQVEEGDELVKLDSSAIEEQVNQQKIACEKALALRVQAEKDFSAAKIAVQEYLEGTYVQALQDVAAKITVAMENLRSAENSYQHIQRMARKGYVTPLQREAQAFAVERAKLDLASAQTAKTVLEKFTKAKTLEELESTRDSAEARMRSEQASYDLETGRLKRLSTQLEKCQILAPREGMVVYANEPGGRPGQQGVQIEEGSMVRERQSIVRLPDLEQMQVKVLVHESKVDKLRSGMRAQVNVQERDLKGTVTSVANQAEPSSWFASNVKDYAAIVRIDGQLHDLKPGMTASVEILVADLKNVISVPIQAVIEQGGRTFCYVMTRSGPQRRQVTLGLENSTAVEVKKGLEENEIVLLNPRAQQDDSEEDPEPEAPVADAKQKFGDAAAAPATAPATKTTAKAPAFDIMQFDKNGDKKISRDEAPERMQAFFDVLDKNHDGSLDAQEIAALKRQMKEAQTAGGAPPGGP